jgi:hypothetical protein
MAFNLGEKEEPIDPSEDDLVAGSKNGWVPAPQIGKRTMPNHFVT